MKWVERTVGEDPADFYRLNYSGYNRSRLAREDFALYRTLSRRHMLDSTIPADEKVVELGRKGRWNSSRFGEDPVAYYHAYYEGLTRGELIKAEAALYQKLKADGLLVCVPKMSKDEIREKARKVNIKKSRIGRYPLAYYRENYNGVTRGELGKLDCALYARLRRDKLLDKVPRVFQDFGDDPVAYYHKHHNGLTRGQLQRVNQSLYHRLRRDGFLHEVPTMQR